MMPIPFFDSTLQTRSIRDEVQEAIDRVISAGEFILGQGVESFELAFASYLHARHAIGVNNGTSALHLALRACGVGPDDEVITTPLTWISTDEAISYVGARPVFVDIEPVTCTLDPERVRPAITPRTKAILPVHLYGQAADLDALGRLAAEYGLVLIEDAAQAHGAVVDGRKVGTFGAASCFSFYPTKNLGAFGEAGAIVTDDDRIARRARILRDHAQAARHHHVEIGFNARMEGLQGAVLGVKLRHLDGWNAARARHARRYSERLADVSGLALPTPPRRPEAHVWHLFVVRSGDREALCRRLRGDGIETRVHYPTLVPLQPAYHHLGHRRGDFPVAEDVAARCLSLPLYPELTDDQIDYTADRIRSALR